MSIVDAPHLQYLPEDFDAETYKAIYKDLDNLSEEECKEHFLSHGIREKRIYKLRDPPTDFDWKLYLELNTDLQGLTEAEAITHFKMHGRPEKRLYNFSQIPDDFIWEEYLELNLDIVDRTENQAKTHYLQHGRLEHRRYKKPKKAEPTITTRLYIRSDTVYFGKFGLIKDVADIKNNDICVFILGNIEIQDSQIEILVKNFTSTYADIMSPTILTSNNKLLYGGGIILNNKLQFINDNYFQYKPNPKNDYCRNTSVLYPSLFITRKKELLNNYENMNDVLKKIDEFYQDDMIIKVTPFAIFKENTTDIIKTYEYTLKNVPSFKFEKEFINYWLASQSTLNLQSLKMQSYPYLDSNTRPYILICENEILTPDRDCGSRYMFHFIELLVSLQFNVHYCCAGNFAYNEFYVAQLQKMGVYVITGYPFCLHEYLKNNANVYKYIFISRLELFTNVHSCIRKYSSKSKCIFITHDLSHLRKDTTNIDELELKCISDSDLSLIVSSFEYEYLQNKHIKNIFYYPICYPNREGVVINSRTKRNICFVGSMHAPNIDAIVFFLDNVFSHIIALDNIKLFVIGMCCSVLTKYTAIFPDNLVLCGYLDDNTYSNTMATIRLNIAPLLIGAGIKGKILDPLNRGIPTLSSKKGIEGMQMNHLDTIIQLDYTDNDYAKYAKEFMGYYKNIQLLDKIAINGKLHFTKWFSMERSAIYFKKMFHMLNHLPARPLATKYKKIAVIYQYMNATPEDIKNFIKYFDPYSYDFQFTFFLVNNGTSTMNNSTETIIYLKGTNRLHEFSAYQEGIDYALKSALDDYNAFFLCNETISKHFPIFLDKLIPETFELVCNSRVSCGVIDNFEFSFEVEKIMVDRWIRSNCLLINAHIMKSIEYKIISFETSGPKLSDNVELKLRAFLAHPRYASHNAEMIKMKRTNILNEYMLTHKLMKYGDIIHFKDIKKYAYNFFDPNYILSFDKVPCGEDWVDIEAFRSHQQKIFSSDDDPGLISDVR